MEWIKKFTKSMLYSSYEFKKMSSDFSITSHYHIYSCIIKDFDFDQFKPIYNVLLGKPVNLIDMYTNSSIYDFFGMQNEQVGTLFDAFNSSNMKKLTKINGFLQSESKMMLARNLDEYILFKAMFSKIPNVVPFQALSIRKETHIDFEYPKELSTIGDTKFDENSKNPRLIWFSIGCNDKNLNVLDFTQTKPEYEKKKAEKTIPSGVHSEVHQAMHRLFKCLDNVGSTIPEFGEFIGIIQNNSIPYEKIIESQDESDIQFDRQEIPSNLEKIKTFLQDFSNSFFIETSKQILGDSTFSIHESIHAVYECNSASYCSNGGDCHLGFLKFPNSLFESNETDLPKK